MRPTRWVKEVPIKINVFAWRVQIDKLPLRLNLSRRYTRWVKEIPIKINVFAWRVQMDKLPLRLNLSLVGIDIQSILCPICGVGVESMAHVVFSCSLARDVLVKESEECVRGYLLCDVVEDLKLSESTVI
ncbi:hypothetical protein CTI12_AA561980 [Artemisia annua]|uniref:Reverse transcriptase zinc-binding domain-containing protein n=1 Tax=Artemisia annua TaxID=35608 RepID=A0A2U1KUV2_ARTAN|nr:hypothetical protein CTI12_AA561980 [Artemisia annua]